MNKVVFIGKDGAYQFVEVADFSEVTLKIQNGKLNQISHNEKIKPQNLLDSPGGKKTVETLRNQLKSSFYG